MNNKFIKFSMLSALCLFSISSQAGTVSSNLSIVNTSSYQLNRVNQYSNYMKTWNFPFSINPNSVSTYPIEVIISLSGGFKEVSGIVDYQITCPNNQIETITINAKNDTTSFWKWKHPDLHATQSGAECVKIMNDSSSNNIGWINNGTVKLILANNI